MTEEQQAEYELLRLASDEGKFAIQLGYVGCVSQQLALHRLQIKRWVALVDLSPISNHPSHELFRIFLASDEALKWFRSMS